MQDNDQRRQIFREAIRRFNAYRRPEIEARLVRIQRRQATVDFRGSSCRSCGAQDHLEDFAYEVTDLTGWKVELLGFEVSDDWGFRARYAILEGGDQLAGDPREG